MTQTSVPPPQHHTSIGTPLGGNDRPRRPGQGARRLAEWVSFGISAAIVAAIVAYLVYAGLRADGPIVPIEVTVEMEKAAAVADDRHVVPITVRNRGLRAAKDVKIEVTQPGTDGSVESSDVEIDYLPQGARETIYLYLDVHPTGAKIRARATQYRLE